MIFLFLAILLGLPERTRTEAIGQTQEKLHDLLMGGHVALKKLHGPMELVSASATGGPAWGSFVPFRRGGDVTRA